MKLVYLDESGRNHVFYFFGALVVDAEAVRSIENGMNGISALIAQHNPEFDPSAEFHAYEMFHGEKEWDSVSAPWRVKACLLVAKLLSRSTAKFIFRGVNIQAHRACYGRNAYPIHLMTLAHTLEELDRQLSTLDRPDELGLVLADEHHSAPGARRSLRDFKIESVSGYTKRPLTRIADTIYFGPSHESRLLQVTDIATFFINRHRTVTETDPRARRTVGQIVRRIRSITIDEYVWAPDPKTQRPA